MKKEDIIRNRWLDYRLKADTLARTLWSVDPKTIIGITPPITREEYYALKIRQLVDEIFEDERLWNEQKL